MFANRLWHYNRPFQRPATLLTVLPHSLCFVSGIEAADVGPVAMAAFAVASRSSAFYTATRSQKLARQIARCIFSAFGCLFPTLRKNNVTHLCLVVRGNLWWPKPLPNMNNLHFLPLGTLKTIYDDPATWLNVSKHFFFHSIIS